MRRSLALLVLLAACIPRAPELAPHERAMVHAAVQSWAEAGLPPPVHCDLAATSFRVGACRLPTSAGCTAYVGRHPWRVVIMVRSEHVGDDKLLAHELMHAMFACSKADGAFDDRNYRHRDPRVWQDVGGDSSVQARTRALALAGTP